MRASLSVVIGTAHGSWPRLRATLDALAAQRGDLGTVEVVVADGTGAALPPERLETVKYVSLPSRDVFELRAAAVPECTGDIVLIMEDHNIPRDDFCANFVRAFADHPDASGVVGVATNGAHRWMDEASFLLTWGPLLAPLSEVPADRTPPPGVVAYRRSVLPSDVPPKAWLEYELPNRLRVEGRLVADDRIVIMHEQHVGLRAFLLNYAAGRVFTGNTELLPGQSAFARARHTMAMPLRLTRQTWDGMRRSRWPRRRRLIPLVASLTVANAVGQVVGLLRGPGRSADALE